ncbi:hypothetical protein [Timonella senegalensis]|uniref:hypothetical protein n=1 Tax=Timonella senegalensis TaxID=1465825 RepID=UPI00031D0210|nr:hypothetical protein [Timonella senegalensis]
MNTVLVNYVSYYAAQVRGALSDLSQESIDDLTEGLEADLIDAMSENPKAENAEELTLNDLIERFGKPRDYADELRTAAGLGGVSQIVENKKERIALKTKVLARWDTFTEKMAEQAWWPQVREFLVTLRPVWWVARAWLVYWGISIIGTHGNLRQVPHGLGDLVLLVGLCIASVLLGMWTAKNTPKRGLSWFIAATNTLAVLFVPGFVADMMFVGGGSGSERSYVEGHADGWNAAMNQGTPTSGLRPANETQISLGSATNLFVYDSEGNLIKDARITSQDGQPINASSYPIRMDKETKKISMMVPRVDEFGRVVANVYPTTYAAVDVETASCNANDKEFWDAMLSGEFSEDWSDDKSGTLYSYGEGEGTAHFVYGPNEQVLYIGGNNNLTNSTECLLGLRIPAGATPEAPSFTRLPVLAPLTSEVESGAEGTESDESAAAAKDLKQKTSELEKLQGQLETAEASKDSGPVKELKGQIEALEKEIAQLKAAEQAAKAKTSDSTADPTETATDNPTEKATDN